MKWPFLLQKKQVLSLLNPLFWLLRELDGFWVLPWWFLFWNSNLLLLLLPFLLGGSMVNELSQLFYESFYFLPEHKQKSAHQCFSYLSKRYKISSTAQARMFNLMNNKIIRHRDIHSLNLIAIWIFQYSFSHFSIVILVLESCSEAS